MEYRVEIPLKLPSCNEYLNACRINRYAGAKMKAETDRNIGLYLIGLPSFTKPVKIHFHWIEGNKRRDLDGAAFGKKFILDAMVKQGKLPDDNRKCVVGFSDTFDYGETFKVIVTVSEVEE